jgi:hypothetical protein
MTTLLPLVHSLGWAPKTYFCPRDGICCRNINQKNVSWCKVIYVNTSTFFSTARLRKQPTRRHKTWLNLLKVMSLVSISTGHDSSTPTTPCTNQDWIFHLVLEQEVKIRGRQCYILFFFQIIIFFLYLEKKENLNYVNDKINLKVSEKYKKNKK